MEAIIGSSFTFQVEFVNDLNIPVDVTNPRITIFNFSGAGAKQTLVNNVSMVPVTPPEVGRYTYTWVFPVYLTDGDTIYADMSGADSVTGALYLIEEDVTAISSMRANPGYEGLIPRFIKGS
jgi:hypothetical protein